MQQTPDKNSQDDHLQALQELQQAILEKFDEDMGIVTLVTGHLENGKPYYAYADIPPSKYLAFRQAEQQGNYDLTKFGEILAHGDGLVPPLSVQQEMKRKYGANHRFEEEVDAMLEEAARDLHNTFPPDEAHP